MKKYDYFPFFLVFYEITTYLSNDMYLPALPEMMRDLHLSMPEVQLMLTTWFTGLAILPLFMGMIADCYGRRKILLTGGMVYLIATIFCALLTNSTLLLIARFIEGAAIPSLVVAGYAVIHELYEQKAAIRILAVMGSITILAPAFGPLLGSLVLLVTSWRGIFWFIAVCAAISLALLYKCMPETLPKEKYQPLHFFHLLKQYRRIITNMRFMFLTFVLGCIFTGFIVWITASPLLIIDSFHYTPFVFGIIQVFIFLANFIGNQSVKYFLEKISVTALLWLGLSVALVGGVFAFIFVVMFPVNLYLFLIGMALFSLGSGMCFAPLNRTIIETSDEPMGIRMALFTFYWTAFAVLGSLIASYYFDGSIATIAYPLCASIVLSCVIFAIIRWRLRSIAQNH